MKGRIKRILAVALVCVLALNTGVSQNSFLTVFAESVENIQDVLGGSRKTEPESEEKSEKKSESAPESTTKAKEDADKEDDTVEDGTKGTGSSQSSTEETTEETTEASTEGTTETMKDTTATVGDITQSTPGDTTKTTETTTAATEATKGTTGSGAETTGTAAPDKGNTGHKTQTKESSVETDEKSVSGKKKNSGKMTPSLSRQNSAAAGQTDEKIEDEVQQPVTDIALTEGTDYSVNNAERTITFFTAKNFNHYQINGGEWKEIGDEGSKKVPLKEDGIYTIQMCRYTDDVQDRLSEAKEIQIDNAAPNIDLIKVDDTWKNPDYKLNVSVKDSVSGVRAVYWERWNPADWNAETGMPNENAAAQASGTLTQGSDGTFILQAGDIADGTFVYAFTAEDRMGNKTEAATTATIKKDSTKIKTSVLVQTSADEEAAEIDGKTWYNANAAFSVQTAQNRSGLQTIVIACDNGSRQEIDGQAETISYGFWPEEGNHVYTVYAVSVSGVEGEKTSVRIKYDKQAPSEDVLASYYLVGDDGSETLITDETPLDDTSEIKVRLYVQEDLSGMGETLTASYTPVGSEQPEEPGGEEGGAPTEPGDGSGAPTEPGDESGAPTEPGDGSSTSATPVDISFTNAGLVSLTPDAGSGAADPAKKGQYYEFTTSDTIPAENVLDGTELNITLTIEKLTDVAENVQEAVTVTPFSGTVEKAKDQTPPLFSVEEPGQTVVKQNDTIYTKDIFLPKFYIFENENFSKIVADRTESVDYSYKVNNTPQNMDYDKDNAPDYVFSGKELGVENEENTYALSFSYRDFSGENAGEGNAMVLSDDLTRLPYGTLANGTFTATVVVDQKAPSLKGDVVIGNCVQQKDDTAGTTTYYAQRGENGDDTVSANLQFAVRDMNLDVSSVVVTAKSKEGETVKIGTKKQPDEGIIGGLNCQYDEKTEKYTCSLEFAQEGTWRFAVSASDIVGNTLSEAELTKRTETVVIDASVPTISVEYSVEKYKGENAIYTNMDSMTVTVTIMDEGGINIDENVDADSPLQLIEWKDGLTGDTSGITIADEEIDNSGTKYKVTYTVRGEGQYQIGAVSYTAYNGTSASNIADGDRPMITVDRTNPVIQGVNVDASGNIFYGAEGAEKLYLHKDNLKSALSFEIVENYLDESTVSAAAISSAESSVTFALTRKTDETENTMADYTADFGSGNWMGQAEGEYYIKIIAKDKAGNTSEPEDVSVTVNGTVNIEGKHPFIVYDTTSPQIEIRYPQADRLIVSPPETGAGNEVFYQNKPEVEVTLTETNLVEGLSTDSDTFVSAMLSNGAVSDFAPVLQVKDNDASTETRSVPFEFTKDGNVAKAIVPLEDLDSHNAFSLSFTDLSGNPVSFTEFVGGTKNDVYGQIAEATGEYHSPVITIDKTAPQIEITFSGTEENASYQKRTGDQGRTFFSSNVEMTIKVTEENFDPREFRLGGSIKKYNETGDELLDPKTWIEDEYYNGEDFLIEDSDTNPTDAVHQFTIRLTDEWNYDFTFDYKDQSGRDAATQNHKISVDKTKPTIEVKNVENLTESDMEFFNGAIGNGTLDFYDYIKYGYFGKRKVAVRIEAHDDTSGIQYVEVRINGQTTIHELQNGSADSAFKDVAHDKKDTWYTVIFLDEDFKGTVEARPVDKSGNMPNQFASPRGVVSETQSKHDASSQLKITTVTRPSNTVGGVNYYNRNVDVHLLMEDDHSGIKSYSYKAGEAVADSKDYGKEAGTEDKAGDPSVNNVYKKEFSPVLTTAANYTNKQNPTIVEAEFTDNAGYTEKVREKYVIDDKKPEIEVTWTSNADAMNEKYYKATRVAHIRVVERNFDENGVKWDINNETGVHISEWNHDGDVNTCTVSFTKDGDFLMNFSITDYAKNTSKWKGEEFTIDKTAPVISITFDNNSAENGNYFNRARTATLHVEEHNFRAEDVKYELSASNDGQGIASPTAGGWSMGSDHHTASIYYGSDGDYSLNFSYTDMAGNPANVIATEEFVVDLTKPTVKIINVEDHNAYNGRVTPGVEYSDTNLDESDVTIRLVGNKVGNADYERNAPTNIHNGRVIEWKDFERINEVDDIYTLEVIVKDKAGNVNDPAKVTFSVNRFGSNYIFGDATDALINSEYPYTNEEIPIEVTEINVSALKEKAVSVRNEENDIVTLTENEDYTVAEGYDEYKWKEYNYVIDAENFAEEGEYTVTLFSEDAASNQMDNVTKDKDIEFVIDKTVPTGTISGLEENSYREDEHEIVLRAGDNYGLDKAVLYVDNEVKGEYEAEEFAGDQGVAVMLESKNTPQNVSMELFDLAGNTAKIGHGENDRGCLITSNAWIQFYNNKPLFISVMGVGAAGILAVIGVLTHGFGYASSMAAEAGFWWFLFGKRKKDEEE